jgi:hypothetical protein
MATLKDLPFLMALLDDPAPEVRAAVTRELRGMGVALDAASAAYRGQLSPDALGTLDEVLDDVRMALRSIPWLAWLELDSSADSLEAALVTLGAVEYEEAAWDVPDQLDTLAAQYLDTVSSPAAESLMRFLFQDEEFAVHPDGRELPIHDHLPYVLLHRSGSMLGLSCLSVLLAARVGIPMDIVCIQGNYLPAVLHQGVIQLFNPAAGGQALPRGSMMYIEEAIRRNRMAPHALCASACEIIEAMLEFGSHYYTRQQAVQRAGQYATMQAELSFATAGHPVSRPGAVQQG